jgi:acyl carrier protein
MIVFHGTIKAMTNLDKLKQAFIVSINLDPAVDWNQVAYGATRGWDSVAHMALISEIENSFDIMLDTEQVIGLSDFSKARGIAAAHGIDLEC